MRQFFFLLILVSTFSFGQAQLKSPSEFYPPQKTKVLVVGTFHFNFPGLDEVKTADEDKIDVLKEPKKSELEELVTYIKKFNPTKIAIEARPSWNAMRKFEEYKKGGGTKTVGMNVTNWVCASQRIWAWIPFTG